jgi:hypothetical protein
MHTVSVNKTQIIGVAIGLLVMVAGAIVNVYKFGSNVTVENLAMYVVLGALVIATMLIVAKD